MLSFVDAVPKKNDHFRDRLSLVAPTRLELVTSGL